MSRLYTPIEIAELMGMTRQVVNYHIRQKHLKASKTYYLKIEDNLENNGFNFIEVDENQGLREISKTGLSGSVAIEENSIVTEIVEKKENSKFSKIDEIKKAHKLKEQGILTLEEFEKLKKEILTK